MSEINVTPLVDVMLVLLIIFMVTAPMMQQGIDVNLPETESTSVAVPEDPLILEIGRNGQLSIGKVRLPSENIGIKIKAIMQAKKQKQIFIRADRHVDYGVVAEAMGAIRGAGITQIGLVTLPKSKN